MDILSQFPLIYDFLTLGELMKMMTLSKSFVFIKEYPWAHRTIRCESFKKFFMLLKNYNFKKFHIKSIVSEKDLEYQYIKYNTLDVDTEKIFNLSYLRVGIRSVALYRFFYHLFKNKYTFRTETLNLAPGLIFNRHSVIEIISAKYKYLEQNHPSNKQIIHDELVTGSFGSIRKAE